jgi:hypothetical protein
LAAISYDVNSLLLVVELSLLVPTLLLLILGTNEHSGRRRLMDHLTNTARMLSRQEYFNSVDSAMRSATRSVRGSITGSLPKTGEQEESVRKITTAIEQLTEKKNSGMKIQYLLPKSQDRLSVAYRYKSAGAKVRFHPALLVSDLRYIIVDDRLTVLGLPSSTGEDQPTREGYSIPSDALAEIFADQFQIKWAQAVDYENYSRAVLTEIRNHSPNVSSKLLAGQLSIPAEEIERLFSLGPPDLAVEAARNSLPA